MKKLINQNVLITGGAGFIGSCLVFFLKKKYKLFVIDDLSIGKKSQVKTKNFYRFSLLNKKKLNFFFKKNKINLVIHLAAHSNLRLSEANPKIFFENNYIATKNLIDSMLANNVKNIIFSSTASVYGSPKVIPISEKQRCKPISVYGKTKLKAEKYIIKNSKKNFKYVIFRFFNVAGSFHKEKLGETKHPPEHFIPISVSKVLQNKTINIFNKFQTKDGTGIRDYIHIYDICIAHIKAIKYLSLKKNNKSVILNLGSKKGVSAIEIIKKLSKLMQRKIKFNFKKKKIGEPNILISSSEKSKKFLGWSPKKN
ncbi:UDP-glucose 4-epimerase GalE, partial [Candidatus Pelagibacter sp.]|nr:UDP-glucose 4-epimerase GalE [Candidatus Pelagibacter sp.]